MISQMAMEDIEALQEEGITVSPEDVVRLNAFGLKVERNNDSSEFFVMPRVAFLGDITFYEPTIGSEIWLNKVGKLFDLDDADTFLQLRAYSLSQTQDQLVSPDDKQKVKDAIAEFATKLSGITLGQLQNVLSYVLFGNDQTKKEERAKAVVEKESQSDQPEDENYCYEIGLLRQGMMYKLGDAASISKMTTSEIEMLIAYELAMKFGAERDKSQHEKNLVEYYGVLDEIRSKHK